MLNQPSPSDLSETISSHGSKWTRREALKLLSVAGAGSAVFARALSALAAEKTEVTGDMIRQAEWISGLELTTEERKLMLKGVTGAIEKYQKLREVPLDNGVPPALRFDPAPLTGPHTNPGRSTVQITPSASSHRPDSSEDLAFSSLTKLSALVRSRQVTSVELTRLYLERLHRYDPALHCVITYTAELALKQAEQADREIAEGGKGEVTGDMIRQAEWISGLELTTEERKLMLKGVTGAIEKYQKLREVPLDNGVPPALRFDPAPLTGPHTNPGRSTIQITPSASSHRPDSSEDPDGVITPLPARSRSGRGQTFFRLTRRSFGDPT